MAVLTHRTTERAIELFHALSDETRLEIIELLRKGERCVCELTDTLDAAQSRLSFHLRVLKDAGIVRDRKDGRWVYYELDREATRAQTVCILLRLILISTIHQQILLEII